MAAVNFLELARQHKALKGQAAVAEMPRMLEALQALGVAPDALHDVHADYQLQGLTEQAFGELLLPMLSLDLVVRLPLQCQRCFEGMPLDLDLHFEYAVCKDAPEALLEHDEVDWLEPDQEHSVQNLIEDELLMALPIAVMHDTACAQIKREAGEKPNPFAVLAQLKHKK